MRRFRKRPVEVAAVQYTGANHAVISEFIGPAIEGHGQCARGYRVPTLEGDMIAIPGDWIIRGVKGEFYPCKPDIFEATYEEVDFTGEAETTSDNSSYDHYSTFYNAPRVSRGRGPTMRRGRILQKLLAAAAGSAIGIAIGAATSSAIRARRATPSAPIATARHYQGDLRIMVHEPATGGFYAMTPESLIERVDRQLLGPESACALGHRGGDARLCVYDPETGLYAGMQREAFMRRLKERQEWAKFVDSSK